MARDYIHTEEEAGAHCEAPDFPVNSDKPCIALIAAKPIGNHPRTEKVADALVENGNRVFVIGQGPRTTAYESATGATYVHIGIPNGKRRFIQAGYAIWGKFALALLKLLSLAVRRAPARARRPRRTRTAR